MHLGHRLLQSVSRFPRLWTIEDQHPIQLHDTGSKLLHLGCLRVIRGLCGCDKKSQNQSGKGSDQSHHQLHGILGVTVKMVVR